MYGFSTQAAATTYVVTRSGFFDLNEMFRQSVKLGDNSRMMVMGKGHVKLHINGLTQMITEVYFIYELRNNLLSIGQLQENFLAILIQHGICKIYHPRRGLIIQTQMSANRMFVVLASVISPTSTCLQVISEDLTQLWHYRYGHLNFKGLRTLLYKEMVRGLPMLKALSKVCGDCMIGKQHQEAMPKKSLWRASKKLQLVHADICGLILPKSNNGKRYLITFIDDYSRKNWAYFLFEKFKALAMFKKYKVFVEKEIGDVICCLRIDKDGEFTSLEFNNFCSIMHGVNKQLTTTYTPQQNGVAKRKNRTIMNMVCSMLSKKEVPKEFWP